MTLLEKHAWGRGTRGQLARRCANGRETRPHAGMPAQALQCEQRVIHLACGADFTLLVTMHGDVWACGANEHGQCGVVTSMTYAEKPMPCLVGLHVTKLSCGDAHTAAITADGRLFCWGDNGLGQCGVGHTRPMSGVVQSVRFDPKARRQYHPEEVPLPSEPDDPTKKQQQPSPGGSAYSRRKQHSPGGKEAAGSASKEGVAINAALTRKLSKHMDGGGDDDDDDDDSSMAGWREVACGGRHTIAARQHSRAKLLEVLAWGEGNAGCLGVGDTLDRSAPAYAASWADRSLD